MISGVTHHKGRYWFVQRFDSAPSYVSLLPLNRDMPGLTPGPEWHGQLISGARLTKHLEACRWWLRVGEVDPPAAVGKYLELSGEGQ